ncbi:UbiA family prenyltransferase [Pelagicoccus sp. SDUM812003]|uniref:UbiA family prenyltransferase n=1 Tax=Pelagicoccus sp. SDUM812003 TaxID=3041267 RepID=UPI00280F5F1E|nr:UbiA family prenyltransferase [Pelagicoccus sp. SDUM812003]MDQ8202834.1 UbiA family prenyltransferase [Pelagicoccus sp. SDUM812003]
MTSLRTHLVLGRVSNLATVWSNIVCAWIIVGGYDALELAGFLAGSSLLYTGGMYLNDYFDREFDQRYRPERPIPSGKIPANAVRNWGFAYLGAGLAAIGWIGWTPLAIAAGVTVFILLYDIGHKNNPISPVYMAACRAGLFLMVAGAFPNGIDTYNLIAAGTVFTFIMGVTFLARSEATDNAIDYPALVMIALPIVGAFYYRSESFDAQRGAVVALVLAWYVRAFLRARIEGKLVIGKTIAPLLASIPLLDLMIVSTLGLATQNHLFIFAAFFAATTAAQRYVAST